MAGYEGLAKQSLDIRIGNGIAESEHDFLTDPPAAISAQNARFDRKGAISKRFGHTNIAITGDPDTANKGETNAIFEHRDQLVIVGPAGCHRADLIEGQWLEANASAPRVSRVQTDAMVRVNYTSERSSCDVTNGLLLVAWEGITPPAYSTPDNACVFYQFFDADTLAPISQPKVFGSVANDHEFPTVLGFANGVFMIVTRSAAGAARFAVYDSSSLATYTFPADSALPGSITLQNTAAFAKGPSNTFLLMNNASAAYGADTDLFTFTSAGADNGNSTETTWTGRDVCYNTFLGAYVGLAVDGTVRVISSVGVVTSSSGGVSPTTAYGCRIAQRNSSGDMTLAFQNAEGTQLYVVDSTRTSLGNGTVPYLAYDTALSTGPNDNAHRLGKLLYLGAAGVEDTLITWVDEEGFVPEDRTDLTDLGDGIAPQPYVIFALPVLDATNQSVRAVECGRAFQDRGYEAHALCISDTQAMCLVRTLTGLTGVAAATPLWGHDLARVDFEDAPARGGVQSQGLRALPCGAGGALSYDGVQLTELTPPRIQRISAVAEDNTDDSYDDNNFAATGYDPDDPDGTAENVYVLIKLAWRWTDARGNVHRGAPSADFVYDFVGTLDSGDDYFPRRVIFPRSFTAIDGTTDTTMQVEVYQSTYPGDIEWHLVGIVTPKIYASDEKYWTITCIPQGATPDETYKVTLWGETLLATYPLAYFESELEAVPPPPLLHLCSTQARLWGLSAEDRNRVHMTKPIVEGIAPEFAAELTQQIPDEGGQLGGECTAIAALDDRVVVFKRERIYTIFGDPGDANGEGSTLQTPRLLSSDTGCIEAASVVEGPFGVAFLSTKGLMLLGRDNGISFIGEAVQKQIGDYVCTSATLVPRHSEVRWTFASAIGTSASAFALVWNYRVNAWSRWTSYFARHACIFRDEYTRLSNTTVVLKETTDDWSANSTQALSITTPWIKVAGLQGFKRLWRAHFLGRHWSGGLTISALGDYRTDVAIGASVWTEAQLEAASQSSDFTEAGATVTGSRLQVSSKMAVQKIESVRFTLTETDSEDGDSTPLGRGFELVGIQLECGMQRGNFKRLIAAAKR
jgi:hypothetical protein